MGCRVCLPQVWPLPVPPHPNYSYLLWHAHGEPHHCNHNWPHHHHHYPWFRRRRSTWHAAKTGVAHAFGGPNDATYGGVPGRLTSTAPLSQCGGGVARCGFSGGTSCHHRSATAVQAVSCRLLSVGANYAFASLPPGRRTGGGVRWKSAAWGVWDWEAYNPSRHQSTAAAFLRPYMHFAPFSFLGCSAALGAGRAHHERGTSAWEHLQFCMRVCTHTHMCTQGTYTQPHTRHAHNPARTCARARVSFVVLLPTVYRIDVVPLHRRWDHAFGTHAAATTAAAAAGLPPLATLFGTATTM